MTADLTVHTYRFPTPEPESDGTMTWDATTAVVVQVRQAGATGLGWTYSSPAAAAVIHAHLKDALVESLDPAACWESMHRACRNLGTKGLVMQAMSAVDIALWDLRARVVGRSLSEIFGIQHERVPVYGSGGFTSMSDTQLAAQVGQWMAEGCRAVKIKIGERWGADPDRDLARVHQLRELAGGAALMVDGNGGYTRGQARRIGRELDRLGVVWFEEPVSSDDLEGLADLRAALDCDVAAGEYISEVTEAQAMSRVVDCLQLDVTRCGGYTGFAHCAAVAQAAGLDVSVHCAPALGLPIAAATARLRHIEYFADHARLEPLLADGVPRVVGGALRPDRSSPGHGMTLRSDAAAYLAD